jgi:hypothetical protein
MAEMPDKAKALSQCILDYGLFLRYVSASADAIDDMKWKREVTVMGEFKGEGGVEFTKRILDSLKANNCIDEEEHSEGVKLADEIIEAIENAKEEPLWLYRADEKVKDLYKLESKIRQKIVEKFVGGA